MKEIKNKFVLYDSTDDSCIIEFKNDNVMLFNSEEEAKLLHTGYPEELIEFSKLPLHWQEEILNQIND
jgi:hypothetical protein